MTDSKPQDNGKPILTEAEYNIILEALKTSPAPKAAVDYAVALWEARKHLIVGPVYD
jgi:hypothetical protein